MPQLWPTRSLIISLFLLFTAVLTSCGQLGIGGGSTPTIPAFDSYSTCAVADFNGDGKLDIAVAYARIDGPPPHPGFIAVYLQDTSHPGTFLSPGVYSVPNDPWAVTAGDLNGDGKTDLVAINTISSDDTSGSSSVSVLLQDAGSPGHFGPATNYSSGFSPFWVAIGDLNQDGKPDLAVADTTGVSILLQDPAHAGQFLPKTTIAVSDGGTSAVAIADLNGDGAQEIIATSADLLIFWQNPAAPGTFSSPTHVTVGAQPISIAVTDLDSDGRPDLAIANLGSADGIVPASLSVLLQNPGSAGSFLPAVSYATGIRSWTIAAADLNNDGKMDLVVGNMGSYDGSTISVLLQNTAAAGAFQTAVNYQDSGNVAWVAPADIDSDGRQDLVITSGGVKIRLQDPANPGTFLSPVVISE